MAAGIDFWDALFPQHTGPQKVFFARMLSRRGRPFLILPHSPAAAVSSLELYPAQTRRARFARGCLSTALKLRLPFAGAKVRLSLPLDDPLARFVTEVSGAREAFSLGVLAGNPATVGRRFVLLVFGSNGEPVRVVKVGITDDARGLIRAERSFLEAVTGCNLPAVPRLSGVLEEARCSALAMPFFRGDSPLAPADPEVSKILTAWLRPGDRVALSHLESWKALEQAAPTEPLMAAMAACSSRLITPAFVHGDFAPWNIKVSPEGMWTVLDWERGDLTGVPGWDWFHYVVQHSILVERTSTPALLERVEALISSPSMRAYAEAANISGLERDLLIAYLLHMLYVIRPSEGVDSTRRLLERLSMTSG